MDSFDDEHCSTSQVEHLPTLIENRACRLADVLQLAARCLLGYASHMSHK